MKSNYKKLSDYIQSVDVRNYDSSVTKLYGISIDKEFMPSVANIIGTDLNRYKVVKFNQFACNPMHVGRDEKLPIACLKENDVIVSPAYFVFQINDENELDPDYLNMWVKRPEFDRLCWFKTDASVRGGIDWEQICSFELPVPYIEKQKEIVKAYKTISDRIELKRKINYNLEATAGAIYHKFFDESNSSPVVISKIVDVRDGTHDSPEPLDKGYPLATSMHLLPFGMDYSKANLISKEDFDKINERSKVDTFDVLFSMIGTVGSISLVIEDKVNFAIKNMALFKTSKCLDLVYYVLCFLKHGSTTQHITERLAGSTQKYISLGELRNLPIINPTPDELSAFNTSAIPLFQGIKQNSLEIRQLQALSDVLLASLAQ